MSHKSCSPACTCQRQHTKLSEENTTRDVCTFPRTGCYFTRLPVLPQILHSGHYCLHFRSCRNRPHIKSTFFRPLRASDRCDEQRWRDVRKDVPGSQESALKCRGEEFSQPLPDEENPTTHRLTCRSAQPPSSGETPAPLQAPTCQSRLLPISSSYCFL